MGSIHHSYEYSDRVSHPYRHLIAGDHIFDYEEPSCKLYGDSLTALSRSTDFNLQRIRNKLVHIAPDEAFDIVHWRPNDVSKGDKIREVPYPENAEFPKWDATNAVFSTSSDVNYTAKKCFEEENQSGLVNKFCYLCSTLEEHQQHLARRGAQLKEKKKVKPRIKYIPPPPTVKIIPKEIVQKDEVVYKFSVKTGQFPNAGTCANVTVKLKGNNGIMTKRPLKKKTCANFTFGRSTTESFYVKGPDIGDLSMLAIEHDGLEQKHAWFLEQVEVTNLNTEQCYLFICNNWLSLYHGDYEVKKVMRAELKEFEPRELEVTVVTADKSFAGTDANVFITVYGQKGVSRKLPLKNKSKNNFEKGQKDKFYVPLKDNIGKITKIKLEHDNSGAGPGWLVEQVIVQDESTGHSLKFPCGRWLATDEEDGNVHRYLLPINKDTYSEDHDFGDRKGKGKRHGGPVLKYQLTVLTGKLRYAGTDARVFMTLLGKSGWSEEFELADRNKDLFEQRQTDVFQIMASDVGDLKRIRVRHDNSGLGAGWFVEKISVKRYFSQHEVKERLKMLQHETDEAVERRASQISGHGMDSPKHSSKSGSRHSLSNIQEEGDFDDAMFKRNKTSKKNKKKSYDSDSDESDKKRNKSRKDYLDSDDDSDDGVIGRGNIGRRNKNKKQDSEDSDSDRDSSRRRRGKAKKMKWIQHAGYKIQVTDSEAEEMEEHKQKHKDKRRRKQSKFNEKYPSDNSSDSDDDRAYNKKKRGKKSSKSKNYGQYYSDSDDDLQHVKKGKGRRGKRNLTSETEESEDGNDKRKGTKRYSVKKGRNNSTDDDSSDGESNNRTSSVWKDNRVPAYDEYIFECNKWLAKDEADGLIDREFKATTVTTFYKVM